MDGILRGDSSSRINFYHQGIMDGWLSPNEVRQLENLPAIDGGDIYLIPLNMEQYSGDENTSIGENNENR